MLSEKLKLCWNVLPPSAVHLGGGRASPVAADVPAQVDNYMDEISTREISTRDLQGNVRARFRAAEVDSILLIAEDQ
jgi:hypothetical protein